VDAPLLSGCPVSIECTVTESIKPGSHELFVGRVEAVHVDERFIDKDGNILWSEMNLL
jgi:flavin reductase (DIM6/NTAB) family NADH-FMN oxidoreductase RutF